MGAGALMLVSGGGRVAKFAEDNDAGWASVYTQSAPGANIVVDSEDDVIVGVFTRLLGTDRAFNGVGRDHVDTFPRANIDTTFTGNAFALVDMDELLWFHGLGEPGSINFLQNVVGSEFRKWWIGVEYTHQTPTFAADALSAALTIGRP